MKKNVFIVLSFILCFLIKVSGASAAEGYTQCTYELQSGGTEVQSLSLADDGSVIKGSEPAAAYTADSYANPIKNLKFTFKFSDLEPGDEDKLADAYGTSKFTSFSVENGTYIKSRLSYFEALRNYSSNKDTGIVTYNALRRCPENLEVVYLYEGGYKHGKPIIYDVRQVRYTGIGSDPSFYASLMNSVRGKACSSGTVECLYKDSSADKSYMQFRVTIRGDKSHHEFYSGSVLGSANPYKNAGVWKNELSINDFSCGTGSYQCKDELYYVYNDSTNNWIVRPKQNSQYDRKLILDESYYYPATHLVISTFKISSDGRVDKSNYNPQAYSSEKYTEQFCKENPDNKACKSFCENHPELTACKQLFFATHTFHFCEDRGILKALKIIHTSITIAKILVPILLIIFGSITFAKATIENNADAIEKATTSFITKLIIGLGIFMIPTIVDTLVGIAQSNQDKEDVKTGDFSKCAACFTGKEGCNYYIENGED